MQKILEDSVHTLLYLPFMALGLYTETVERTEGDATTRSRESPQKPQKRSKTSHSGKKKARNTALRLPVKNTPAQLKTGVVTA